MLIPFLIGTVQTKNRTLGAHKNNFKISFAIKNNALSLLIEAWGSGRLFSTSFFLCNSWHINLFNFNSRSFELYKTGLEEHPNSILQKSGN